MASTQVQYNIGGMSCSFCAETITKAYGRTDGVDDVDVSLAHEELRVKYDDDEISEAEVKDVVRDLGYTIRDPDKEKRFEEQQEELDEGKRRLWISGIAAIISLVLMAVMVARNGWNIFAETDARWMWYGSLALALVTMFGPGRYIKNKTWQSLKRGIFNQHVLLEAGAFAGLAGGFLGWFVFTGRGFPVVHFFVVSTFITTYHILSEYTSLIVRTRASRAVNDLMVLQPDTARHVTDDGEIEEIEIDELNVGDRIRVKPGENIPIDGEVIEGESAVDESVATGESAPIDKLPGDEVIGGSVNETGTLLIEVTATGEDAFLNQVARQIEEARAMKPDIVQLADRILKYFVPGVLSIAVGAFLFWVIVPTIFPGTILGTGPQFETAAFAALAALVLGYPCALGMATPLALIRGGGEAAKRGILMRSGDAFQVFQEVDHIVLDKTGTITEGEPAVDTVVGVGDNAEVDVVRIAASAEAFSEHPLADAVLDYADEHDVNFPDPEAFDSVTGKGVRATIDGDDVLVGKPGWLTDESVDLSVAQEDIGNLQGRGLTTVGVVVEGTLIGLVGIGDEIKPDAKETLDRMKAEGITPVMITGDNDRTAQAVADEVGIERVMAEVLPDDKREEVKQIQDEGHRVAMVGDGINDAPALTQADIGIAIGAGTDTAIESADIVLMGDRLGGVMNGYEIGETSYTKTRQNLLAAFSFNGIGVTVATTGLVHPVFAMIAMVASVSAVLANSFAGQLLSGEGIKTDFSVETVETEEAEKTEQEVEPEEAGAVEATDEKPARETMLFAVDLHCEACEERVRETLSTREGVRTVEPDATQQRVNIAFNPHVTNAAELRQVIGNLGYSVTDPASTIPE
ncbi:heavy metal translocating P-type ATPase [Halolamina sp. C58]|uniref:heavy metal translocating P-type ATPase n=1 Tax=Halolamina sp. C58 TaxID=3421640 RepID=UPI003EC0269D